MTKYKINDESIYVRPDGGGMRRYTVSIRLHSGALRRVPTIHYTKKDAKAAALELVANYDLGQRLLFSTAAR